MKALVAFVGPSLPAAKLGPLVKAAGLRRARVLVLPPAARGDVFRALAQSPSAIAVIDGVFEARPSVWHRELLAALDAGVAVFGGASMGALRAAELAPYGMVGIGEIFRWLRDGQIVDDSEVALLHGDREHGYRPLTVPLVNVRHALAVARAARVLTAREANALFALAAATFYQERHWPELVARVAWSERTRARFAAFAAAGLPDLKQADARACFSAAAAFAAVTPPRKLNVSAAALGAHRL